MKKVISVLLMSLMGLVGTYAWAGSAREDSLERLKLSTDVLKAIMAAPDNGIPEEVLDSAKCLIVVPNLIKGGFIFGGKHGRGVATCRTSNAWSAPAFVSGGRGKLGSANRRGRCGSRNVGYERTRRNVCSPASFS